MTRPTPSPSSSGWPHIAPFAVFMAFIGIEEGIRLLGMEALLPEAFFAWTYPIRLIATLTVLYLYRRSYTECSPLVMSTRALILALAVGAGVFVGWIHLPFTLPGVDSPPGFDTATMNDSLRMLLLGLRLFGAVAVVPLMEELFWRSFLPRYILTGEFRRTELGRFTPFSFVVTSLLFGLEHHFFYAGVMAGAAYNLLLLLTRSLPACILAHSLTNLLLGLYVLISQRWYFW